ncbi:hypothetical protein AOLI_G00091980 [Acnodon oligacanthus]
MEQRRWIHAPEFLRKSEESWPAVEALGFVFQDDPEVRKNTAVFATAVKTETPTVQLILFFSDWMRLLKAVAWYLRLKDALMLRMKGGKEFLSPHITHSNRKKMSIKSEDFRTSTGEHLLTINDLAQAERAIIACVQRQAFPAEIASLEVIPPRLHRSSNLCRLVPLLDKGIMRIKSEDSKVLQDYAMFLRSCCNAMEDLDTVSNMRSITLKLPYKLREKWRNKAWKDALCVIPVKSILGVEKLDENAFNRKNMFQVLLSERPLYVQAGNCVEASEWIEVLSQVSRCNPGRLSKFHPSAYVTGMWLCCKETTENLPGCRPCTTSTLANIQPEIDCDRETERIFSLYSASLPRLQKMEDACASMSVYLGQQKEQEEYSAFIIQDPKETFRTIKEIREVLEELKAQHADTEALTDQPGTIENPIVGKTS